MTANLEFYGFLGRASFSQNIAHLRFYEHFVFAENEVTPVFEVTFNDPQFHQADIDDLRGAEGDVVIFSDRVDIGLGNRQTSTSLRAKNVSFEKVGYDEVDLRDQVALLSKHNAELQVSLRSARKRNVDAFKFAIELLRRAEIKAIASEDLKLKHQAAVTALEQIVQRLSDNHD